jgi:predicted enzyme related to lactoylglutathione lyase
VRFDQVKILARDAEALADFYEHALGCVTVVPLQDLDDDTVPRAAGVPDADIKLTVLRLPGRGEHGPVIELYSVSGERPGNWHYQPGQGQLAFEVDDLEKAMGRVGGSGGNKLGDLVEWEAPKGATARFVYMQDPEGNIIYLWSKVD